MLGTIKKLNYLFNKTMKIQIVILLVLLIIGSFLELLGVSIVLPIVNIAMDATEINDSKYVAIIVGLTGAESKENILLWLIGCTIGIYFLKNIYLTLMYRKMYRFAADTKRQMATRLMKAYLKQPYSFFLECNTSELIRGVNSDTAQLYEVVINCLMILANALTALEIIVYLAMTNIVMTLTVAGLLALCASLIIFVLQKKNRQMGRRNQKLSSFMIQYLQQAFDGIKEIKLLNNENHFIEQYNKSYREASDISVKSSLFGLIPKYVIEVVCISGILLYLGLNIIFNPDYMKLMPQLAVFCVAAYKLLPSVNAIYGYFNTVIFHRASVDLVYKDIMEADKLEESFENNVSLDKQFDFENDICMQQVSFMYAGTDRYVLHNTDLVIKKGQSVALIGGSGGGKTTTADLILSLLTPNEGSILVDDKNITENIWGWRKKIGYIPQMIYLTDDTIRNNIAFGINREQINDEQVWKALEDAQLKEFVMNLPNGLDTMVGERGTRISGGQRQRIGIARALYRDPEILVFDEATSALDNETEKEVMKSVEGLQGVKTIIMIAHRLSTIQNCDVIYRVENGKIEKVKKEELF